MARILVVDDEKVMVKGIRFNVENEGYTVDVGYNGRQAVDLARANDYDLIILDLMMPELDGLEACMEIRAFSSVPIIMLTAREFDLLELLMRHPNRVYSREQLLNLVWGYEYTGEYRTVDVHIRRIREKVEADPANPTLLCTKWGVGYYFHGN